MRQFEKEQGSPPKRSAESHPYNSVKSRAVPIKAPELELYRNASSSKITSGKMARDQYQLDGAGEAYGGSQGLHRPKDSPFRQTHLSEKGDREMEADGAAARTDASVFARAG